MSWGLFPGALLIPWHFQPASHIDSASSEGGGRASHKNWGNCNAKKIWQITTVTATTLGVALPQKKTFYVRLSGPHSFSMCHLTWQWKYNLTRYLARNFIFIKAKERMGNRIREMRTCQKKKAQQSDFQQYKTWEFTMRQSQVLGFFNEWRKSNSLRGWIRTCNQNKNKCFNVSTLLNVYAELTHSIHFHQGHQISDIVCFVCKNSHPTSLKLNSTPSLCFRWWVVKGLNCCSWTLMPYNWYTERLKHVRFLTIAVCMLNSNWKHSAKLILTSQCSEI